MAVELRFGKPNVDYQKYIFCAAAFMAARWSAERSQYIGFSFTAKKKRSR